MEPLKKKWKGQGYRCAAYFHNKKRQWCGAMPLHNGGWVKRVGRAWYQFLRPIAISCSYLKWTINTELDRYFESLYYRSGFGSARQNWRVFLLFPTFFCHPFLVHKILFFRFVLFLICTGSVLISYQLVSRYPVWLWTCDSFWMPQDLPQFCNFYRRCHRVDSFFVWTSNMKDTDIPFVFRWPANFLLG